MRSRFRTLPAWVRSIRRTSPAAAVSGAGGRTRLVVHLVEALDSAHMESGLLNLIRHLPAERYRHAVVCLRDQGDYEAGLREQGVDILKLHQHKEGGPSGLLHYLRLYRVLRILAARPDPHPQPRRAAGPAGGGAGGRAAARACRIRARSGRALDAHGFRDRVSCAACCVRWSTISSPSARARTAG
jgi:hypothetical protein